MKKLLFSLIVSNLSLLTLSAQNISTVAGNGSQGNTGNGGAATAATMYHPYGVCLDSAGNIYIADQWNHLIRKVNTSGNISVFAGTGSGSYSGDGGQATLAALNYPAQVYAAKNGNIYIADEFNNRIRMVNTSGVITTVAGDGSGTYSGDGSQATAAGLNTPTDVTFDASGNMYIADYSNHRVREVSPSGVITTIAGTGTAGFNGDGSAATNSELNYPYGVAVDKAGNVYISDRYNNRIRKVNTAGIISTVAGNGTAGYTGDGTAATSAEINNPFKVNLDANGNIYIADFQNSVIRWVDAYTGIITTIAGDGTATFGGDGGPATAANLNYPGGVYADDKTQTVYVGDNLNDRVRAFTFTPMGVMQLNQSTAGLSVYPNPSTGRFTVVLKQNVNNDQTIGQVFNVLGEEVKNFEFSGNSSQVDMTGQPSGIYLYRVMDKAGNLVGEGKLVIEK